MSEQQINDGGPAHPVHGMVIDPLTRTGISIRDYFAAAALHGLLSGHANPGNWQDFAADSYHYADAMLERRKR